MIRNKWFAVEQGMYSPRDNAFSFRLFGYFETQAEATKEAKKLGNARVLYVEVKNVIGCKPITPTDRTEP